MILHLAVFTWNDDVTDADVSALTDALLAMAAGIPELVSYTAGTNLRLRPGGEARLVVGRTLGADTLQRWLDEQGFPTEQVFGSTPGDVLRLITCTGPYDSEAGRYTENRIVTALPAA